jgi:hypothetical protein
MEFKGPSDIIADMLEVLETARCVAQGFDAIISDGREANLFSYRKCAFKSAGRICQ